MPSKKMTGDVPRRWMGWRTEYPTTFPVELIITRRRPAIGDDPARDCAEHGYVYRTGSIGCPSCLERITP
jgi:hypothetical protein